MARGGRRAWRPPSLQAALPAGLRGALLAAVGRSEAASLFAGDRRSVQRSFVAALLAVPLLVALHAVDVAAIGLPSEALHRWVLDALGYVIGWAGFVLASYHVAAALGRAPLWGRFVLAWNWCSLVQYALLLAGSLPALAHAPAQLVQASELVALGWALWLEWFAARLTLGASPWQAGGLVGLDLGISLLVAAATAAVSGLH